MRAVLHFDAGPAVQALLASHSRRDLELVWCAVNDRDRLREELGNAEVLLHVLDPVTDELLAAAPRLRLVQKLGVGVNTIDLDAARTRGIAVANMPGVNAPAVAEHALALLLAVLRRLPVYDAAMKDGRGWLVDPAVADDVRELSSRRVGLVGHGSIARALEALLRAAGARVLYTSSADDGSANWRPLDRLIDEVDVISLHAPLVPATAGLLSGERLRRLPAGAIVVNTARGGLVDQPTLVELLASRHFAGAGLDVFADEPVAPGDPLLALDNVVLTPHVAWLTVDTMARCLELAVQNCVRLQRHQPLANRVV